MTSHSDSITRAIYAMAELFGQSLSDDAVRLYLATLAGQSEKALRVAIVRAMRECTFMPRPHDILDRIAGRDGVSSREYEDAAEKAWACVVRTGNIYSGAHFEDPAIVEAIRRIGGWSHVCNHEASETKWVRKEFKEAYVRICQEVARGLSEYTKCTVGGQHEDGSRLAPADSGTYCGIKSGDTVKRAIEAPAAKPMLSAPEEAADPGELLEELRKFEAEQARQSGKPDDDDEGEGEA